MKPAASAPMRSGAKAGVCSVPTSIQYYLKSVATTARVPGISPSQTSMPSM